MRCFNLVCKICRNPFQSQSGATRKCDNCRKCLQCGSVVKFGHNKFCSMSCRGKYVFHNNSKIKEIIERRVFQKVCNFCGKTYQTKSASRKKCPDCCKCEFCGKQMPNGSDRFCGLSCSGKWKFQTNQNVQAAMSLGPISPIRGKSISKALTGRPRLELRGENNPNWKGGGQSERHFAMGRVEYFNWRRSVFRRDGFKCMNKKCITGSKQFHAHHILSWKDHPDKRYEITNGITVCVPCHKMIHSERCCEVDLDLSGLLAHCTTTALSG